MQQTIFFWRKTNEKEIVQKGNFLFFWLTYWLASILVDSLNEKRR